MVKYIRYKGEDIPVRISYYALKMLKAERPNASLKADDYEGYETLLYYSLKQGYKKVDKPFPFTKDDMEDIADECFFDFVSLVPHFFQVPEEMQKMLDKDKTADIEEAKKKLTALH